MKLIFLVSSLTIIYYMRVHPGVKQTYDKEQDTFRVPFLVIPCTVVALLMNQEFSVMEVQLARHHQSCSCTFRHWNGSILE